MQTKKPWLSKMLWMNLLMAVTAIFVPGVNDWIKNNVEVTSILFTGVNVVLRLVTKDKLSLID